jgi:hypothetical protein
MPKKPVLLFALGLVLFITGQLLAHSFLIGLYGGPCSYGVCASSCHGYPGGTIYIDRFPDRYQPALTYCIKVGHNAGDSIENFNCCITIKDTCRQAGRFLPGYYTEVFHDSIWGDGVHALGRCDSCNFYWVAPDSGTDSVRLCLGGFQGIEGEWGYNTEFELFSAESHSGVGSDAVSSQAFRFPFYVRPNPFNSYTSVFSFPSERFALYDISGRRVGVYKGDRIGEGLSPGVYFLRPSSQNANPLRIVKLR